MEPPKLDFMRKSVPNGLTFSSYSSKELMKLSVVKIITPLSFNALGHPLAGGLYDPAMGPLKNGSSACPTCSLKQIKCHGHIGHIELPLPVLNPLFHKAVATILKICCLQCHRVLIPKNAQAVLIGQIKLLNDGYVVEAQELENRLAFMINEMRDVPGKELEAVTEIENYVNNIISQGSNGHKCWKGEGDYRSVYIKIALSQMFKGKKCPYCKNYLKKITSLQNKILVPSKVEVAAKVSKKHAENSFDVIGSNFSYLMPSESKTHLTKIFHNDGEFIKALIPIIASSGEKDPMDTLFLTILPVTPINARPVNIVNGSVEEHPQNAIYKSILNDCLVVKSIIHVINNDSASNLSEERKQVVEKLKGKTITDKLQFAWQELQTNVDALLDVDMKKSRNIQGVGLKQIIEKKEGIIRMNIMGKRVNFAGRTVITPDPNLNIDEIGIPEEFAKKLTFPAPVTMWNVSELRKLIINGPEMHPGANFLENEDKTILRLHSKDIVQRKAEAKKLLTPGFTKGIKIVHRHLINGDVLLLNRQPTLHRPSIMAHKARVLKGEKTLRLHYANCKAYNADFDGDEMNAHFPQNEVARSEAYNIVGVSHQYLVPKDGTPLSGLIQDHIISGVRLSIRGKFFTKSDYMHLIFQALSYLEGDIKILPPALIKPVRLWSGKQIISTVIINVVPKGKSLINLFSKAKIPSKAWEKGQVGEWKAGGTPYKYTGEMSEGEVVIRQGELLCGVLDKMHCGATPYSLVHCVHELYGGETSTRLLSSLAKLFTAYLQTDGFTLGVEDILVVKKADKKRGKLINTARKIGDNIVSKAVDIEPGKTIQQILNNSLKKDSNFRAILDHQYKISLDAYTNDINKICLPAGLLRPFPSNNLQLMVQSGAKGSTVNTMQISCLLGQIELEGRRPPLMASGKSLPSFPAYDTSPRAGGFVDGRFMTGIKPQEFFFHCMAGREGLIDTAVKTSRSGYLQRCLVKHLEGISVGYDMTVRDSDGSVIQFLYGEDGMDVTKCQFLNDAQFPFLVENIQAVHNRELIDDMVQSTNVKGLKKQTKYLRKWKKHSLPLLKGSRSSPFSIYTKESLEKITTASDNKINPLTGRTNHTEHLCKIWRKMPDEEKTRYIKMNKRMPDPINCKYQADRHFGAITEMLDKVVENYLKTHKNMEGDETIREMLHLKSQSSLCAPGEPVGLLAAQSIGEPSTQMTLNTFHFAGRGEMNVTLGIPRLREVLMVASANIKTPSMQIPFRADVQNLEKKMEKLRRQLTKVTLADVLEKVEVSERLQLKPKRCQAYMLKMYFLPYECYKEDTVVTPKKILLHVEKHFLRALLSAIKAKGKKSKELVLSKTEVAADSVGDNYLDEDFEPSQPRSKMSKTGINNDYQSSDDDAENDDDDATTAKRRVRHNEEMQYSDLEDDDEEVIAEIEGASKKIKEEEEENESINEENAGKSTPKPSPKIKIEDGTKSLVIGSDVLAYRWDTENYQWCEVTLHLGFSLGRIDLSEKLKTIAKHSVISEVPGIKRAFITTLPNGEKVLKTDGQNLKEMYSHPILDLNRLYTNDIHAFAETYGIEGATKAIVKEVQDVFKAYGITVNPRHLSLVADYMTFFGYYRPLNRKGMEGSSSPLQQMSFESSLGFLRSSVIRSQTDNLKSPSSRQMLGQPVALGTAAFDLMYKLSL